MDMLNFMKSRRSTRKFRDNPVEEEKLAQVVEAGCYAPSGGNNQSWHFVVIQKKEVLVKLAELVQHAFCEMDYDETTYASLVNSIRLSKKRRLCVSLWSAGIDRGYQQKGLRKRHGG